ncbi:hypothetical protein GEMRC1_011861 [Eukaryota sp. GEM-RC1]
MSLLEFATHFHLYFKGKPLRIDNVESVAEEIQKYPPDPEVDTSYILSYFLFSLRYIVHDDSLSANFPLLHAVLRFYQNSPDYPPYLIMHATENLIQRYAIHIDIYEESDPAIGATRLKIVFDNKKCKKGWRFWGDLFEFLAGQVKPPFIYEKTKKGDKVSFVFPKTTPWFHYEPSTGIPLFSSLPDDYNNCSDYVRENHGSAHLLLVVFDVVRMFSSKQVIADSYNDIYNLIDDLDRTLHSGFFSLHDVLKRISGLFTDSFRDVSCVVDRSRVPLPHFDGRHYEWICCLSNTVDTASNTLDKLLGFFDLFNSLLTPLKEKENHTNYNLLTALDFRYELVDGRIKISWWSLYLNRSSVNLISHDLLEFSYPLSASYQSVTPEFQNSEETPCFLNRNDKTSEGFCQFLGDQYERDLPDVPYRFLDEQVDRSDWEIPPPLRNLWKIVPQVGFTNNSDGRLSDSRSRFNGSGWLYPVHYNNKIRWVLVTNNHVVYPCKELYILCLFKNNDVTNTQTLRFHSFVCSSPAVGEKSVIPQIDVAVGIFEQDFSENFFYDEDEETQYSELFKHTRYKFELSQDPIEFTTAFEDRRPVYLISHPGSTSAGAVVSKSIIEDHDYHTFTTESCSLPGSSGAYWSLSRKMMTFSLLGKHFTVGIKFWRFRSMFECPIQTYVLRRQIFENPFIRTAVQNYALNNNYHALEFLRYEPTTTVLLYSALHPTFLYNILNNLVRSFSPAFYQILFDKLDPFWKRLFFHAMTLTHHFFGRIDLNVVDFYRHCACLLMFLYQKLSVFFTDSNQFSNAVTSDSLDVTSLVRVFISVDDVGMEMRLGAQIKDPESDSLVYYAHTDSFSQLTTSNED